VLGASAIRLYTNAVKMVVASALNEEGDPLFPRTWNHEFIDLPRDNSPKQPILHCELVTKIFALAKKKQHRMFFVLCASAGLRHGRRSGSISSIFRPMPLSSNSSEGMT
jgi:hypothetical protein